MTNAKISRVDADPEPIENVAARATDAGQIPDTGQRIIVGGTNDVGVAAVAVNRLEKGIKLFSFQTASRTAWMLIYHLLHRRLS